MIFVTFIYDQNEIIDEYKKKDLSINSSLIKQEKFHVSLNVMCLGDEDKLSKFCNGLQLFQQWLKIFIFEDKTVDEQLFDDQQDGIFLDVIKRNDYMQKFKDIYSKINNSTSCMDDNGLCLFVKGANHFNQQVIFLDFEHECKIKSESNSNSNNLSISQSNNTLVLQLFRMIYELIGKLCKQYKINWKNLGLAPHCTLMKLSKMKRGEMQKLKNYNKINDISKTNSNKGRNGNKGRNANQVYGMDVMSVTMNNDNLKNKIMSLGKNNYQTVTQFDLCKMGGSSKDGYYNIVQSCSLLKSNRK